MKKKLAAPPDSRKAEPEACGHAYRLAGCCTFCGEGVPAEYRAEWIKKHRAVREHAGVTFTDLAFSDEINRKLEQEASALPFLRRAAEKKVKAMVDDQELLPLFVALIRNGDVTKSAASKLKIGQKHAKRLRKMAVDEGLLQRRHRG